MNMTNIYTNQEPYILSIEYPGGEVKQHGFHLGTDERLAKQIAEERFDATRAISVALYRKGEKARYFDFRREWSK
jgi:hypothetical protein